MKRFSWTKLGAALAITLGMLAMGQSEALAFGHSGSSGSWGSGSSGSSGSWGGSSSSGSWGSRIGWRAHRRHHWRSVGYSSGSWGSVSAGSSSSGSWGSSGWGSSGGSASSSSGGWAVPAYGGFDGVPVVPPQQPQPPLPPVGPSSEDGQLPQASSSSSASFVVQVPAEAKVFVNGLATKSTGTERRYTSRGLLPGHTYTFNVRVEYVHDGKPVTETKVVRLTAGSTDELAFGTDRAPQQEQVAETGAATKLTVQVPENAKVYLADRETHQTGAVREYVTTQLAPGTQWEDYVIRVTVQRSGQTLSQERTITLVGGESQHLEFAFDQAEVATTLAATPR